MKVRERMLQGDAVCLGRGYIVPSCVDCGAIMKDSNIKRQYCDGCRIVRERARQRKKQVKRRARIQRVKENG